jgi:hypothetical protein
MRRHNDNENTVSLASATAAIFLEWLKSISPEINGTNRTSQMDFHIPSFSSTELSS